MVHTVVKINIHEIHKFHQAYNYAMARIQSHLIWLDPHFVEAIKYSIWQERNWTQESHGKPGNPAKGWKAQVPNLVTIVNSYLSLNRLYFNILEINTTCVV